MRGFMWTVAVMLPLVLEVYTVQKSKVAHFCSVSNDHRRADCRGQYLGHVPKESLPVSLEQVDLSHNILERIHNTDFSHLPHLKLLNLEYNNISVIEDDAFRFNSLLEDFNIFNNSLTVIPNKALRNLTRLQNLEMSNNFYNEVALGEVFSTFTSLRKLSVGGPFVKELKKSNLIALKNLSLFKFAFKSGPSLVKYEPGSLKFLKTKEMWFDVAMDNIPNELNVMLNDLANKSFDHLRFRNLFEFVYYTGDGDIFQGLQHIRAQQIVFFRGKFNEKLLRMALINIQQSPIKELGLYNIDFARSPTFVDSGAGSSVTNLTLNHLVLSGISNPDILRFDWRFTWLKKIRRLSIWNINFNFVPCDAWLEMGGVEVLNVSRNQLRDHYLFNRRCDYTGTMPVLHTFDVSFNQLTSLNDFASFAGEFEGLQILDVSNNQLQTVDDSVCNWKQNISKLIAHHNALEVSSLRCLPTTVHFLDLSFCKLDQLDVHYFQQAVNLRELLLSGNKIKFIPSGWKSPNLQYLSLDGNSFGLISMNSFKYMPSLATLRAGNNPYYCTCDLYTFIQKTTTNRRVNITDWPENYKCYYPEHLLNKMAAEFSPGRIACDMKLVILISVITTASVVIGIMAMCYCFDVPWYTKATFQIIRAKYRAHKEGLKPEQRYDYHAFISYSHSDADWVRNQLLPCLESSRPPYRVCIHERDFTPGKWIIDNIIENIENSLKVIVVLSQNFVDSEWCNYELYFAQQRAIGKTFSDVILVVKEPIDPNSLPSKYCKLKKMLSTKTYLEWPQQPKHQGFFWAQLKSVLGKPSLPQTPQHQPGSDPDISSTANMSDTECSESIHL
ncbi:toll-like receptor 18 [Alosa sapidissima]|uniref:toll-like receptor 18 n=1 Tax=Alosa sapidissima TaxID=34773 RepID=UPI001C0A59CB|nr:toll-like receptor 18 [Alosa sapidissima]